MGKDTDNRAVLLDAFQLGLNSLTLLGGVLLGILGESLALALIPILVEATLNIITHMLSPNGGKGTKTTGSLNITNQTNDNHGGSLNDGDGFNDFLLVHL